MLLSQMTLAQTSRATNQPWPHPIPARIGDGANKVDA